MKKSMFCIGWMLLFYCAGSQAAESFAGLGQAQHWESFIAIPDTPVRNQEGRELNFYRDLVKGKIVAINFIFTTGNVFFIDVYIFCFYVLVCRGILFV